jgi:hypothetical protein
MPEASRRVRSLGSGVERGWVVLNGVKPAARKAALTTKDDGWLAGEDRDPTEGVERLSVGRQRRQQFARQDPAFPGDTAAG